MRRRALGAELPYQLDTFLLRLIDASAAQEWPAIAGFTLQQAHYGGKIANELGMITGKDCRNRRQNGGVAA